MVMTTSSPALSLGDALEGLHRDELRIAPSAAFVGQSSGDHAALLGAGAPTNQQIIDATKTFYNNNRRLVDPSTNDTKKGAQQHPQYVRTMNSYDWKSQRLSQTETDTVSNGLGLDGKDECIWCDTIDNVKSTDIFTTVGVGVSADLQFFVGGAGGIGALFDIAKREGPKGYGYVTGELGLRVALEFNVQVGIFNLLPSQLNKDIYGLKVSISPGISLSFQVFYTQPGLTLLGYAVGAGVGAGGGATVFGGHVWNFG